MNKNAIIFIVVLLNFTSESMADQQSVQQFADDCELPFWLEGSDSGFQENLILTFPDATSDSANEQLTISRASHPILRIEARIPRPAVFEDLPSHFFVMISTPSGAVQRASVAQLHNHSSLKRRLLVSMDEAKQSEFISNYNLSRDIHASDGLLQYFKTGVDVRTGNTSYVQTFWRTATRNTYNAIIEPEYSDHSATWLEGQPLYDHLLGFKSFPDDLKRHYHYSLGHKVEFEKKTVANGRAFAFILNAEGDCMYSKKVELLD